MIITIHQPEHMPWLGFFHKMSLADVYVLLDNVQFKKNNWQNRNRIINRNGMEIWLTVPVLTKGHMTSTIKETIIDSHNPWQRNYLGRIQDAYCRHPYYSSYFHEIKRIIYKPHTSIAALNYDFIQFFREILSINNRIIWASDLDVHGKGTDLLLDICTTLNANKYISGPDGRNYLNLEDFKNKQVEVEFHHFLYPVYPAQHYLQGLSALDLIMNQGANSKKIIGIE